MVDVQPLTTRVRVSTPQRECWDETRVDEQSAMARVLCRAASPVAPCSVPSIGGSSVTRSVMAMVAMRPPRRASSSVRPSVTAGPAPRRLCRGAAARNTRCSVARRATTKTWQERIDGYRVTYVYNGRRQVTEMPNRPGERIRVRVDVSPAE